MLEPCYDALVAPETWPEALHQFARSVDAVACAFFPRGAREERLQLPASPHYKAFLEEFIGGGWAEFDHRGQRGWPRFVAGQKTMIEHDVSSDEDRRHLPQYHELYAKYDVPWWAAVAFKVDGKLWAVPFLRSSSQGAFSRAEAKQLLAFEPHFTRLVRLAKRLAVSNATITLDAVAQAGCAAVLIDWRGAVIAINAKADELFGSVISLARGRLVADNPSTQAQIEQLIAAAIKSPDMEILGHVHPVVVQRPDATPLLLDVLPISGLRADVFLHARALITITDIGKTAEPSIERLRKALGLTAGEARLAKLIGMGMSPAEVATVLGLTRETCRTVLKRIFVKAGVSRQSQLAIVVSRIGRS